MGAEGWGEREPSTFMVIISKNKIMCDKKKTKRTENLRALMN